MRAGSIRQGLDLDRVIGALALAVLGVAIVLLWTPTADRPAEGTGVDLAVLESTIDPVRRRPRGTLVWDELGAGARLFEGDALFVPPASTATVRFSDGTRLALDENTLIALEPLREAGDPPRVRVRRGELVGAAGPKGVSLIGAGGEAKVTAQGAVRVTASHEVERIDVLAGEARMPDGTRVSAGSAAVATGDAWTPAPAWPVRLAEPKHLAQVFFTDTPPEVTLTLGSPAPEGARIEVRRAGAANTLVRRTSALEAHLPFTPPSPGRFEWQVVDATGKPLSEMRTLLVTRDLPPVPLTPRNGEIISGYLGEAVPLSWSRVWGVRRYQVQVSEDEAFTEPLLTRELETTSLLLHTELPEGQFHWRVRAFEPKTRGDSPWSAPHRFRFIHRPLPEAPELMDAKLEIEP